MSLHAVSHCQSYTHAVLHVGFTQDRNPSMHLWHFAPHLPDHIFNHWNMVEGWCVTRVIQSCMSNHIVQSLFTCSVIVQSLCCVSLCMACIAHPSTSRCGHHRAFMPALDIGIHASGTDESLSFTHIVRVIHIRCRSQSCVDRTP